MSNEPHFAIKTYKFNRSKYQIKDLIDSAISKNKNFFWQRGRTYGEMLLNLKVDRDTITFFLLFDGDDLEWVQNPDSVSLLLADIAFYQDYSSTELLFSPEIDTADKMQYEKLLDTFIIKPIKNITEESKAYIIKKISSKEIRPQKWIICKNEKINCDSVFIDDYIRDRFLGHYEIIPKDSL
jgi:hypothetical protein